jgi:hypothetical protein
VRGLRPDLLIGWRRATDLGEQLPDLLHAVDRRDIEK